MRLILLILLLLQFNCIIVDCRGDRKHHQSNTKIFVEDNSPPTNPKNAINVCAVIIAVLTFLWLIFNFTTLSTSMVDLTIIVVLYWIGFFIAPYNKPYPAPQIGFGVLTTFIWTTLRITWLRSI